MEYTNEELKTTFSVPDVVTVRRQLVYFSNSGDSSEERFVRIWNAAKTLIENWKSEVLPDININLDEITNPDATALIVWAGLRVMVHMNSLKEVPKN